MSRIAMITGAASGIGRAAAERFVRSGAEVVLCDIDENGLRETEELLERIRRDPGGSVASAGHSASSGTTAPAGHLASPGPIGSAIAVVTDMRDEESIREAVRIAIVTHGRLDVAVNNAGIEGLQAAIQDMPVSDWERVMDVNLTGVFRCMKHQIPEMLRQRSGSIINVASIMGVVAAAHASAYVASKHGLIGLTRAASLELASHGIRVNAVCPAYIVTPMLERAGVFSDPGTRHAAEALHPLGRLGDAEEVASLIHWLGSEEASFVTGAAMMVDGGYTVQ